ncbi:GtrA family protein [Paraburkholderia sp. CNPSo 3272]|uniref:GtrA family protein n=1 Tax=Paraburkholderia sp. CNPSo 3272 TaxID=2940931 RepID=UPI0020B86E3A|nr:GtrA family protein [Paraburkholderia sp. CNPSo 3272]MCP3726215.1 GtrA family protein [Paraburkholderia sp. CNPSo 3272]
MLDLRMARRFALYAGVGAIGTGAQYAILIAMVRSGCASPAISSMAGAAVGAVVNYSLNRRITFRSNTNPLSTAPKFAVIALLGVMANGVCMKFFATILGVNYLIAQMLTTALVLGMTYLFNSAWTFNEAGRFSGTSRSASKTTPFSKIPAHDDAPSS